MRIFLQGGGEPLTRDFGKVKRKFFKDQQWFDFGHFVASWNTPNIGNVMREKWLEDDGGQSIPTTISFPVSPTQPFAVSYTYPARERDDDLGLGIVQFTDPLTQIYNISYLNFKRK